MFDNLVLNMNSFVILLYKIFKWQFLNLFLKQCGFYMYYFKKNYVFFYMLVVNREIINLFILLKKFRFVICFLFVLYYIE